jgi:hypothetical protein
MECATEGKRAAVLSVYLKFVLSSLAKLAVEVLQVALAFRPFWVRDIIRAPSAKTKILEVEGCEE